jgi:hypothetical protein
MLRGCDYLDYPVGKCRLINHLINYMLILVNHLTNQLQNTLNETEMLSKSHSSDEQDKGREYYGLNKMAILMKSS